MFELPVRAIDVDEQVSVPPAAVAPGGVMFCATDAVVVELQPLEGSVTVSVYVPGLFTAGFGKVEEKLLGPDQE